MGLRHRESQPVAEIEHIPVAAIGIAGYLVLAGLALARQRSTTAIFALLGWGFSLYLTRIEKYVLQVWCLYCVISLAIITLLTVLSIWWWFIGRWYVVNKSERSWA